MQYALSFKILSTLGNGNAFSGRPRHSGDSSGPGAGAGVCAPQLCGDPFRCVTASVDGRVWNLLKPTGTC